MDYPKMERARVRTVARLASFMNYLRGRIFPIFPEIFAIRRTRGFSFPGMLHFAKCDLVRSLRSFVVSAVSPLRQFSALPAVGSSLKLRESGILCAMQLAR